MQTILGAGGAIGKALATELTTYTNQVRLVSRTPVRINATDELVAADLMNAAQTDAAVAGSEVVYLTAGLPYKTGVWQQQWPVIMQNVIQACQKHGAKLVFFDNVYMYDSNSLPNMNEETPVQPISKKGKVRAQLAQTLLDEVAKGKLTAMIVRAADFYGPGVGNSAVMETVYKNLKKGKKAMWLADATKVHSCTYVPDAAKATALLGNTPDAFNQAWHLPTSDEKLTGKDWVELFAKEMGVAPNFKTMGKGIIRLGGLFVPFLRELIEMLYQNEQDYFFNSQKFNQRFNFKPTSYQQGVKTTVQKSERQNAE
jgi:nucleoside-diphosphate-sugar epimerase